jgi:GT2 family glycosyltransferase
MSKNKKRGQRDIFSFHKKKMNSVVSIMCVTYNRLDMTQRTLKSLSKNTNVPYRLIIVDNGSTDGTADWLTKLFPQNDYCIGYDYHIHSENKGIAAGRNQGLRIAEKYKDDWLSTIDNDIEVPFGWLKDCIDILEANPQFVMGVNMEDVRYPVVTLNGKSFQNKPQGNLGTACTVFPRKLHEKIGYFNTEYELYGEDDADFFFRARVAGYQMGYIKEMGVHFGQGELDTGEYRDFKDVCRSKNLAKFIQNCRDYAGGRKANYIPFVEK